MISNVENLTIRRRKMLIGFSFGFSFSLIAVFISSISSTSIVFSNYRSLFLILALFGWIFWFYNLIRILNYQRKIKKDPKLSETLNDEYIQLLRLKSFNIAFWIILVSQGFIYITNMFYKLSVELVILLNIFIAVLAAILSFIILDREK
jgi:hypothetical protein